MTSLEEIGAQLQAWAEAQFGAGARAEGMKALGGHSQVTIGFALQVPGRETEQLVLKVPPPGVTAQNNFDVLRQVPVLQALAVHGVAAPQARYWSRDTSAFGGPFLMMTRLRGSSPGDVFTPEAGHGIVDRDRQFGDAVRMLARIHAVGDEAFPEGAVSRDVVQEIDHWVKVVNKSSDPAWIAQAMDVRERLLQAAPAEVPMGLVHGDYYSNNWVFDGPTLSGVVDWEGASIGPVLIDLGWLCVMYDPASWGPRRRAHMGWQPEPAQIIEWYHAASPLDLIHID